MPGPRRPATPLNPLDVGRRERQIVEEFLQHQAGGRPRGWVLELLDDAREFCL